MAAPDPIVSDAERAALLAVAREALVAAVRGERRRPANPVADGERLGGAFVTVTVGGLLRGCIGILDPDRPLASAVAEAAQAAATRDARFPRLAVAELPRVRLEVSILGAFVRMTDPLALRLGEEGVVVSREWRRGLLLPEVAPEHGLDARGMLDVACRKAGLSPGAWHDAATTVWSFRTVRFGGPALP
jgi:AmmeMemoRadiSam system protein A